MAPSSAPVAAANPPPGVIPDLDHPTDALHTINQVSGYLCICLTTLFVLTRVYIRARVVKSFGREDWVCLFAWVWATLYFISGVLQGRFGGGYHEYEITESQSIGFGKALYADTIVYGPSAYLTKVALLLIFVRVFTPFTKTVIFIYIFIFGMLGYYVPVLFIKLNICTPIKDFWKPEPGSRCFNQHAIFVADTVMSAVTDSAILIIPIPIVWSLKLPLMKRLKINALIGAGGIATAASIVRLILVVRTTDSSDATVTFVRFNLLGVAELGIGLICASLPAFNILFGHVSKEYSSKKSQQTPPNTDLMLNKLPQKARRMASHSITSQSNYIEVGSRWDVESSHAVDDTKSEEVMTDIQYIYSGKGRQGMGHHAVILGEMDVELLPRPT